MFRLYNGVEIPETGFGTWQIKAGGEAYNSTISALEAGYRHIDTAYAYENEESVGKAVRDFGIKREEVFITTKLPSHIKSYDGAMEYFDKSNKNLGLDYIDLYLIHAPWPWSNIGQECTEGNIEAWKAFIEIYRQKKARAIGVSNFLVKDMKAVSDATGVQPMVNQIRYFIGNTQPEITGYCKQNGILVEAYSPLATGELIGNETLKKLAVKYGVSVAQICLKYCLQNGVLPLPKSTNADRIKANLKTDFTISAEDMSYLDGLSGVGSVKFLRS